jgi:hypothetical protein
VPPWFVTALKFSFRDQTKAFDLTNYSRPESFTNIEKCLGEESKMKLYLFIISYWKLAFQNFLGK